jgi:hypothetical protein
MGCAAMSNGPPPGESLEDRIKRLEKVIKMMLPIHINSEGELEQIDFNNPPLPPP